VYLSLRNQPSNLKLDLWKVNMQGEYNKAIWFTPPIRATPSPMLVAPKEQWPSMKLKEHNPGPLCLIEL
jgi:hypothetical protein